jgi:SAM-dependent methyltransferase
MKETDSLERIVPRALDPDDVTGRATLALHVERYRWAAARLPLGLTLDLACGVGYGSVLLAERHPASRVVAADLSRVALAHARSDHGHPRVMHVCGDGGNWAPSGVFAGIVSLETLEHVPDPELFLRDLVRLLAPNGVLVTSVPVTPSVDANPHHVTDFTERSILSLGHALGLTPMESMRQIQPFSPIAVVTRSERRTQDLRRNLLRYYLRHPGSAWKRLATTLRNGFTNHYLTIAWKHSVGPGR